MDGAGQDKLTAAHTHTRSYTQTQMHKYKYICLDAETHKCAGPQQFITNKTARADSKALHTGCWLMARVAVYFHDLNEQSYRFGAQRESREYETL